MKQFLLTWSPKAIPMDQQNNASPRQMAQKQLMLDPAEQTKQLMLDAVEKTLVNQRNTHEQALKTIAASYATALDAVRNETGKSDDAKLAVENYHQILSRKFDDFQQEAVIEKDALKTVPTFSLDFLNKPYFLKRAVNKG